jgi:hypothetical protein
MQIFDFHAHLDDHWFNVKLPDGAADWELLAERLDNVFEAGLAAADLEKVVCEKAVRLLHLRERPLPGRLS